MQALASLFVLVGGLVASPLRPRPPRISLLTARAVAPVSPRNLPNGAVVELWHNGRLCLGNSRGMATARALLVDLSSGEQVKVDGGQLVDVWEAAEAPTSSAEWREVHNEAASLLGQLPPQVLDLQPLWKELVAQEGGSGCVVSCQVAEALFTGLNLDAAVGWAARRVAAAQLLGEERVLFKRQQGELIPPGGGDGASGGAASVLRGGGFKPLPRAQAESRAEGLLLEGLRRTLRGERPEWVPAVLPLLAELEMAALGVRNTSKLLQRTPAGSERLLASSGTAPTRAAGAPGLGRSFARRAQPEQLGHLWWPQELSSSRPTDAYFPAINRHAASRRRAAHGRGRAPTARALGAVAGGGAGRRGTWARGLCARASILARHFPECRPRFRRRRRRRDRRTTRRVRRAAAAAAARAARAAAFRRARAAALCTEGQPVEPQPRARGCGLFVTCGG